MNTATKWLFTLALGVGISPFATSQAGETPCDRSCLGKFADQLIDSMVTHDPTSLPLSRHYAATENSVPAALSMMVIWRTATSAKGRYYVIDPQSGQVFLIATISEGPSDTLLFGRVRVEQHQISEIEIYTNRSRGQGGFQFDPDGPAHFPDAWTKPIAPEHRATRAALLQAGRSNFDTRVPAPDPAASCVVMENGKVVAENPDVLKAISAPAKPGAQDDNHSGPKTNPDGSVPVPCGNPAERPTDKHARTSIIDEERGVVVSIAVVHGITEPYLVTNPTESAFVPNSILAPYATMLKQQEDSGRYKTAAVRQMAATGITAQVIRVYDGQLQGLHLLVNLGAPGAHSPWVHE